MTKKLAEYSQIVERMRQAGIEYDQLQWRGFALGLACRGFDPQSRKFVSAAAVAMNGGTPLPGVALKMLLGVVEWDLEKLKQGDTLFADFLDESLKPEESLQGLADLALGLSLGLAFNPEGGMTAGNSQMVDFLQGLSNISRVDPEGGFDREDEACVLGYIRGELQQIYKKYH